MISADLATKIWVVRNLTPYVPQNVIGDVFRLTLAYNPGAAFSMSLGRYSRFIFGGFAVVALFVLWNLYRMTATGSRAGDRMRVLALACAWGGAAGNLLDRFRSPKGVVDFIDVGYNGVRFYTFNVADSAVTVGAVILALSLAAEDRRNKRLSREAPVSVGAPVSVDAPVSIVHEETVSRTE